MDLLKDSTERVHLFTAGGFPISMKAEYRRKLASILIMGTRGVPRFGEASFESLPKEEKHQRGGI